MNRNRTLHARLIRQRGDLYFYYLNDLDRALSSYSRVIEQYTGLPDNVVRVTKIKIGDVYRAQGLKDKAETRYRAAAALRLDRNSPALDRARRGALRHMAEAFLRRGELEEALKKVDVNQN